MNADGSNQTRITTNSASDRQPSWSPDGTRLAFVSNRDGNDEIYVMNADGSSQTRLTNNAAFDFDPAWSPDGTRIAFTSTRDFPGITGNIANGFELYVMNADGTNPVRLTNNSTSDSGPSWSPDGTRIAFTSQRDGLPLVYVMNADGSNQINITQSTTLDSSDPEWSPDGSKIAFTSYNRVGQTNADDIFLMNADGSNITRVTNSSFDEHDLSWQPLVSVPTPTPTPSPTPTPTPKTIQFSAAGYSVSETGPRVDITLTRSGDTTSSASVNYATIDAAGLTNCNVFNGIASPRCDYENTIGTATWAAGDATSKTFSIAIIDDAYAEGTETFTIGLSNPTGAALGSPNTATVTITDNDSSNDPNPIDSTNFFVRQQYIDFLGREPDPPGLAGWISTINNCSGDTTQCDRIHVSQQFFQSAEFQDRGYFVYRFYDVAFGRKPDYGEFVPDLASVSGFLDANQLEAAKVAFIAGFMARPAFVSAYNSLTNTQYVDALLNNANAGISASTRQSMIDGLNNSTLTRAQVLRQIVESTEVSTKYNHQAFAVMEYFGYLRRQPDGFYLQWIAVLDATNDPRGMVTGFVTSQEYRNRFGP